MLKQTLNPVLLAKTFLMLLVLAGIYIRLSGQAFETVYFLPCVFKGVTSIPCPGCGMTRACLAILQGEFSTAWRYHPFSFLLIGLIILTTHFQMAYFLFISTDLMIWSISSTNNVTGSLRDKRGGVSSCDGS